MTIAAIIAGVLGGAVPLKPVVPLAIALTNIPISLIIRSLALTYGPVLTVGLILKKEDENDPEILRRISRQFSGIRAIIVNLKKQRPNLDHGKKRVDQIANTVADETLRLSEKNELEKKKLEELINLAKTIDVNQIKEALNSLFKTLKEVEENIDLYLPLIDDIKVCHKDVKEAEKLLKAAPAIIKTLNKEIEEISFLIKELGGEEVELIDQYLKKAKIFSEKLNAQLKEANVV